MGQECQIRGSKPIGEGWHTYIKRPFSPHEGLNRAEISRRKRGAVSAKIRSLYSREEKEIHHAKADPFGKGKGRPRTEKHSCQNRLEKIGGSLYSWGDYPRGHDCATNQRCGSKQKGLTKKRPGSNARAQNVIRGRRDLKRRNHVQNGEDKIQKPSPPLAADRHSRAKKNGPVWGKEHAKGISRTRILRIEKRGSNTEKKQSFQGTALSGKKLKETRSRDFSK